MSLYVSQKYVVSFVADWFHAFPHVDITFRQVNATFDPSNSEYLEALGILIAIPGFWLILTLLAFLIFFLCRCCDTNFKRKRKLTPYKWALAIFALLCCGALAVGLFGNNQAHSGIGNVQRATENMADMVLTVKNETKTIERLLEAQVNPDLRRLNSLFGTPPAGNTSIYSRLQEAMLNMQNNVSMGIKKMKEINAKVDHVDLQQIPVAIHFVELFRWPATIALLCLLILVCLLLLWGVIRHSRCMLILFSVLGLLSVVICWVLVSVYLGICVAGSDFCKDPDPFLYKQASGSVDATIMNYYLQCNEKSINPFSESIKEGTTAMDSVKNAFSIVTQIAEEFYPQEEVKDLLERLSQNLDDTDRILGGITALLDCQAMHKEYNTAMGATCYTVLDGTAFMLASAAGSGLFFTVLIWIASHTWIHIRKKRPAEHVDEEDPFLPPSASGVNSKRNRETYGSTGVRPRYSHTPPQTPHFPGSLNGRSSGREDHSFLQGRYTPPPAYDQLSGGSAYGNVGSKMGMKP